MVSNDDFDGKATHLNCFYLHINFEQKYPKPTIVLIQKKIIFSAKMPQTRGKVICSFYGLQNPFICQRHFINEKIGKRKN